MSFNLNWFLGVLAIELWLAPYLLMFWPEIRDAWRHYRAERALAGHIARYQRPDHRAIGRMAVGKRKEAVLF